MAVWRPLAHSGGQEAEAQLELDRRRSDRECREPTLLLYISRDQESHLHWRVSRYSHFPIQDFLIFLYHFLFVSVSEWHWGQQDVQTEQIDIKLKWDLKRLGCFFFSSSLDSANVKQSCLSARTSFLGCMRNLRLSKGHIMDVLEFSSAFSRPGVSPHSCPAATAAWTNQQFLLSLPVDYLCKKSLIS